MPVRSLGSAGAGQVGLVSIKEPCPRRKRLKVKNLAPDATAWRNDLMQPVADDRDFVRRRRPGQELSARSLLAWLVRWAKGGTLSLGPAL